MYLDCQCDGAFRPDRRSLPRPAAKLRIVVMLVNIFADRDIRWPIRPERQKENAASP